MSAAPVFVRYGSAVLDTHTITSTEANATDNLTEICEQVRNAGGARVGAETDEPKPALSSRRRNLRFVPRATVFVSGTGDTSADLLAALAKNAERVYVIGRPPAAREILAATTGLGARIYLDGHFPLIVAGGKSVTWSGSWFGDAGHYSPADASDVFATLGELISGRWKGDTPELLQTPATTGRDLWLRTIPPATSYPVLSAELQTLVRAGAGQGRIETLPGSGPVVLHEYDARLAYVALTRRMPVGTPTVIVGGDAELWLAQFPYSPARVLCSWSVPAGWGNRPGILPVHAGATGWRWPATGAAGPSWVESSELAVARQYGWPVEIHAVIGWEQTGDVFRTWQERLLAVMAAGAERYASDATRAALFRSAVRSMLLHTLGSMHGAPHKVTGEGTTPPDNAEGIRAAGRGRYVWWQNRPPAWPELVHPEWSATIWGRARARLLSAPGETGALNLSAGSVVAFRTDAIYTSRVTGWDALDDGAAGRYRLKSVTPMDEWPANGTDILAAKGMR